MELVSMEDIDTEEQLRGRQNDEFKALKECFADQLVDLRKLVKVSRNPKKRKRDRLWIPLDLSVKIESRPEPIAEFDLHIKCTRKYPLVPPAIGFKNVKGIGRALISKLHKQLKYEAANEEHKGQGCIALLIMRAQQFLEDHYRDLELNNKSFYDQMVEQKQSCDRKAELSRKQQDELDKRERERQVEEIRQKILRKRELFHESKKRRDSQNSNVDIDQDESTYDYDGDLEAESTTTSQTDEGELTNRIDELDELAEDEETLVTRSRRSTFVGASREIRSNEDLNSNAISRVDLEYEVIEELGHGGFGTVYKVRNRVDSRLYALKKVKLNPDNETLNEKIMREVKLLSRLNHENVIRYYTAWNEIEIKEYTSSKKDSSSNIDDSALSPKLNQESCIISQRNLSSSSDDETDDVYHTSYLINDKNIERIDAGETTANYVVFETSDNRDENEIVESMKKALGPRLSDDESSCGDDESRNGDMSGANSRIKTNRWLYIQMELGQGTLREAIDQGLPKQKDRARRFFREILDGLCHIHRQGIIHRDLKPVNIFLDSMDRPKIGDFGLATTNLFIVTQSGGPGVSTATAIKPNRMSLEKLRLLASPEHGQAGDSPSDGLNKSGERLKYIHHHNHTDNIGTPLYMSPELSATNEKARIAKVIYSHKVDVYSLGIIYFEMLYPFKTGHERVVILQDLRKKEIRMPGDVEVHLTREDVELIRLLLTHDVSARPTSEKLSTSSLLPSVGLKEREYQNMIKQVVQNRQARTHKHMLRLLFEQNDSYVDDFVFDFEDVDGTAATTASTAKPESQNLLKDFNTTTFVLDQVKMKLELLLRSRGYVSFVAPILMPKYSASKYYQKQQLEDVVMLMDKNSSILTMPYDLRLPFARTIARTDINYMNRFAIERIFRQRQILGYHPDQLWECCVDIVTPPPPPPGAYSQLADAEILHLTGEVVKTLPVLLNLKPVIKVNHIQLVKSILGMLGVAENQMDDLLRCLAESMGASLKRIAQFVSPSQPHQNNTSSILTTSFNSTNALPQNVKEDLKRDLLASKVVTNINLINTLINFLDIMGDSPLDVYKQIEHGFNSRGLRTVKWLDDIKKITRDLEETFCYAQGLGLDLTIKFSPSFVLGALRSIEFYSGMVCLLECRRSNKIKSKSQVKTIILAVGGRYDRLIERFSRSRSEVFDQVYSGDSINERDARESRPKTAVGVSFEVEKLARFMVEDYLDKVNNQDHPTVPPFHQLIQMNSNQPVNLASAFPFSAPVRYWPIDIVICSLTHPKSRSYTSILSGFIKQLRDKGLKCNEIASYENNIPTLESLATHCLENKIPYLMTIKCLAATGDDFNQSSNIDQTSPSVSPSSPMRPPSSPTGTGCIAIMYQADRGRLKEMKRCDIPAMLDYLINKR